MDRHDDVVVKLEKLMSPVGASLPEGVRSGAIMAQVPRALEEIERLRKENKELKQRITLLMDEVSFFESRA